MTSNKLNNHGAQNFKVSILIDFETVFGQSIYYLVEKTH